MGKKKYAAVEADILTLNERAGALRAELEALVQADAEAFAPLAAAYGLPKDTPEQAAHKAAVLETALDAACAVPLEIMGKCAEGIALVEEYAARGSALAVSDAGCAAALCKAALQAASLNDLVVFHFGKVFVHTAYVGPAVAGSTDLQRTAGVAAEFDLGRHCLDQVGVPLADVVHIVHRYGAGAVAPNLNAQGVGAQRGKTVRRKNYALQR